MQILLKFMTGLTNRLKVFILFLEAIMAIAMLVMVVLSFIDIAKLVMSVVRSDEVASYSVVQQILAHALLLVIAIELAMMLVNHSPSSVLEVALYAIAKKMLLSASGSLDLLIGAVAMAVVFAIDKYLHSSGNIGTLFQMASATSVNEKNKITPE